MKYIENVYVKQTVPAGATVLFCAVWESTDKFYVSFNGNGATSGTMLPEEITHGVSESLPLNEFEKKINGKKLILKDGTHILLRQESGTILIVTEV